MNKELENLFGGKRPLCLNALHIPASLAVVALAPHPDDFDAIGVTMRFFKDNGNTIEVGVVTSGASGVEDGFGVAVSAQDKGNLREREQTESVEYFGLPQHLLSFLRLEEDKNGDPVDNPANLGRIRTYLLATNPDLIFMPHWNDTNIGHQRTYALFLQVVKTEKLSPVVCLNLDPKTISMRSDFYMTFGPELVAWKRRLLCFHQSQQQRNIRTRGYGFDDRILLHNRKAAESLGRAGEYAEVFELELYEQVNVKANC